MKVLFKLSWIVILLTLLFSCNKRNNVKVFEQEKPENNNNQGKEIFPDEIEGYHLINPRPRIPEVNDNISYWIKGLGGMPVLIFEPYSFNEDDDTEEAE